VFDLPLKISKEMMSPTTLDSWIQLNVLCNVWIKHTKYHMVLWIERWFEQG